MAIVTCPEYNNRLIAAKPPIFLNTLLVVLVAFAIMIANTAFAEVEFIGEPEQVNPFITTIYKQKIVVAGENITVFVYCEKGQIAINPDPEMLGAGCVDSNMLPYGEEVFDKICKKTPKPKPENSEQKNASTIPNQSHNESNTLPSGMYKYTDDEGVLHLTGIKPTKASKETEKRIYDKNKKIALTYCKRVVEDLKDQWPYYDNFKISDVGWGMESPVNLYNCTISATHINNKNNVKTARVEITQRAGSQKFIYHIVPDRIYYIP
jgi:hypothetical protein